MGILIAALFTSSVNASTYQNVKDWINVNIDSSYLVGDTVSVKGEIGSLKEGLDLMINAVDPAGKSFLSEKIPVTETGNGISMFSYEFTLDNAIPGEWTLLVATSNQYTIYSHAKVNFRVYDTVTILASDELTVPNIDGSIDSENNEWQYAYDIKYWKPFEMHPAYDDTKQIAFKAQYIKDKLYLVFDVPDETYNLRDFVEVGIDVNNVGKSYKSGDNVYILRAYRDGTTSTFKLGSEFRSNADRQHFTVAVKEAADIRVQIFDGNGELLKTISSMRNITDESYKGTKGIAGMKIDDFGNIYMLDSDSGAVMKFDADGNLLGKWGELGMKDNQFLDPTGIALDHNGYLYVADTGNARVQKFNGNGELLAKWGSMGAVSVGVATDDNEEISIFDSFRRPEAITIDQHDNVYVLDRSAGTIKKFDNNGNLLKEFGSLNSPFGIAIDKTGALYVTNGAEHKVYKYVDDQLAATWGGFGTQDGKFKSPYGVATDSSNNVYVVDGVNNRVQKFDSNGKFLLKWGERGSGDGELIGPHGIAVADNKVYVADTGNDRIQVFDSNGQFLLTVGSKGSEAGKLDSPEGLAVDSAGYIYVTELQNKRVQKFDDNGNHIAMWGSDGVSDGNFKGPFGIAINGNNEVYVADPFNKRIQKFDSKGNFIEKWSASVFVEKKIGDSRPEIRNYVAYDTDGNMVGILDADFVDKQGVKATFVEDGVVWKILHIFNDTVYVSKASLRGDHIRSWTPDGIATDSHGNVYIVDRDNTVAKKFDSNGNLIAKWGKDGSGDGEFSAPTAMAIDSRNNVYVADTGNSRIQKFASNGNFILAWGTYGTGKGKFNNPLGLAVDGDDNVYVLDNGNSRVQKFDSNGKFLREWGSAGNGMGQFGKLSPEGISVDNNGNVYVADIPGKIEKATHWIAEFAIPLKLQTGDTFGIYLAEGTYHDSVPTAEIASSNSFAVYNVYRKSWPMGSSSVMPGTWAYAKVVSADDVEIKTKTSIDNVRVCNDVVCGDLDGEVLAGNRIVITSSTEAERTEKFASDSGKLTLQYYNGKWNDIQSKSVSLADNTSASFTWMPMQKGEYKIRTLYSGIISNESASDEITFRVSESEEHTINAELKWLSDEVRQDNRAAFEIMFTDSNGEPIQGISYDTKIVKGASTVLNIPLRYSADGNEMYRYKFKEDGNYAIKVNVLGMGTVKNILPVTASFSFDVNVLPIESPIIVNTIQKSDSMRISLKNHITSNIEVKTIVLSLENIEEVSFRLPEGWLVNFNKESNSIMFSAGSKPLMAGESIDLRANSKLFVERQEACIDIVEDAVYVALCK
jgi:sugar lactone lactonase YvrE